MFLDYNQNAKDRTVASAYSVRPTPDVRVSTPLRWGEVPGSDPATFTIDTVPTRIREVGDPSQGIDEAAGSLEPLLALAEEHEAQGLRDAPWPPHYEKQPGEPPRVQPSKRRTDGKRTERRRRENPLVEIARAATTEEAMAGLDRWKERHADVVPHLQPPDVLVDAMRGRFTTWTRIRVNLRHVPKELRPAQEPLEVDYDPWAGMSWPDRTS